MFKAKSKSYILGKTDGATSSTHVKIQNKNIL
jgi:hypothetical protein